MVAMATMTIRVADDLRQQVYDAAQADGMSMSREISWLLYAALYLRGLGQIQAATFKLTSEDDRV